MTDLPSETARIDRLEIRLTEQEVAIEDLSVTIRAQWQAIDRLNRQVARLTEQLEEATLRGGAGPPEPPPPHY